MGGGRGVLDVFHKQTASQGSKERVLSRRALGAAAVAAAAVAAATAAAALLGSRSPGIVVENVEKAETAPPKPNADVHDVDAQLDARETSLRSLDYGDFTSKLRLFPALVTLLSQNDDVLLDAALKIDGCAEHLDAEQASWLRTKLLDRVCNGHVAGAAYARVVARGRVLGLTDAGDLDVSLLRSLGAIKEYVVAISADLVTFDRVLAIASALVNHEGLIYASTLPYASIIETDLSLAAIARRCTEAHKSPETQEGIVAFVKGLVKMGEFLPETMGVVVSSHPKYLGAMRAEPPEPHVRVTLMHARFIVAAKLREGRDFVFTEAMITGLRQEYQEMRLARIQQSALVVDTIVFLANLAPREGDDGDLLRSVDTYYADTLHAAALLALWKRHALVRAVVPKSPTVLEKLLIAAHNWTEIDEVIDHDGIDGSVIEGVKRMMTNRPWNASAIERMGVRTLEPFLDTIETVLSGDYPIENTGMVLYYAALGRSGRRATTATNGDDMDVLRKAWEQAPNSVLDAARYWNVNGKALFDLLVAGAKWGRYGQISKMTNLFGDWTPDSASFTDAHARIVGAFFGLCERGEALDGDWMARCWLCSESGTHDDAMVALVFRRKAESALAETLTRARSRGFSGIHGFLLVPGNGPSETSVTVGPKGWSNSPSVLHAEKVALVASSEPADVARAVRMTPWLVTFVAPMPMLMALITLVPECAAFLDNAQRAELRSYAFPVSGREPHLSASSAIVESVNAAKANLLSALSRAVDFPARAQSTIDWPVPKENENEMGEADIRRMLSSAYTDQIRGVPDINAFIDTRVIEPLRTATNKELLDVATALITEYNVLLQSRNMDAWVVPETLVAPLFGKRRFV